MRQKPCILLSLALTVTATAGCTSSRAAPADAAAIRLAGLPEAEAVLDAQPVGDGRVGWALTNRRVLQTADDGDSWHEVRGPWTHAPILGAFTTPDDALLLEVNDDGGIVIHRTMDAGRRFAQSSLPGVVGTVPRWLHAFDREHATMITGPPDEDPEHRDANVPLRILTTADGGTTWTDEHVEETVDRAWIDADGNGYLNATGPARGLYRLTGHNRPWQRLAPPGDDATGPGGGPTYRVVAQHGRHVVVESHLATGMQVIYRLFASGDAGTTWRAIDGSPLSYVGTGNVTATGELSDAQLVTAMQSVDIGIVTRRTDDGGSAWRTVPTGSCASRTQLRTEAPRRIWIFGDLSACEGGARDGATRIARSADAGATWTRSDPSTQNRRPR